MWPDFEISSIDRSELLTWMKDAPIAMLAELLPKLEMRKDVLLLLKKRVTSREDMQLVFSAPITPTQCKMVLDQIPWQGIMENEDKTRNVAVHFYIILGDVTQEKRNVVFDTMQAYLLDHSDSIITTVDHVSYILSRLDTERKKIIFEKIRPRLTSIDPKLLPIKIENSGDFQKILAQLDADDQRSAMYFAFSPRLYGMKKNALDFKNIAHYLTPQHRDEFYERCKGDLPGHVNSLFDLKNILTPLTAEQGKEMYDEIKKQTTLSQLIANTQLLNLELLLDHFPAGHKEIVDEIRNAIKDSKSESHGRLSPK
jgi:hypothetical protein